MKTDDIRKMGLAYVQVLEKSNMDPVNPSELKGTHAQRKDKDIDNDGKVDKSDEYLHKRRQAISKAMKKEATDTQMGTITVTSDEERKKRAQMYRDKKAASMKKEEVEQVDELSQDTLRSYHAKAGLDLRKKREKLDKGTLTSKDYKQGQNRATGLNRSANRMEEVEIDEASDPRKVRDELKSQGKHKEAGEHAYKHGLGRSYGQHFGMRSSKNSAEMEFHKGYDHAKAREDRAARLKNKEDGNRMFMGVAGQPYKEEVEQVDEISMNKLKSYYHAAKGDADTRSIKHADGTGEKGNVKKFLKRKAGMETAIRKAGKKSMGEEVTQSQWPIYSRILEKRDAHVKGATPPEPIDSKASKGEKDFVNMHGGLTGNDSGIDGVKAAMMTAKAATANVKVAPKRRGDQTIGDKTMPKAKV